MGSARRGPKRRYVAHAARRPARGRRAGAGDPAPDPGGGACSRPAPRAPREPPPFPTASPLRPGRGQSLPSPPGMHGGRSCGPRTRREPSSGEEAAPVTAMAAESALQVVEKLQARLAANPDPKKVSEWAARSGAGVGARRGPVTVAGAAPSRSARAAGARTRGQALPGCGLGREVRGHWPLPARRAGGARRARGLGCPGSPTSPPRRPRLPGPGRQRPRTPGGRGALFADAASWPGPQGRSGGVPGQLSPRGELAGADPLAGRCVRLLCLRVCARREKDRALPGL